MIKPIVFSILIFSLILLGCVDKKELATINFENVTISAEVADTSEERSVGLMNRVTLDSNSGMLFVFPEEKRHSFWMKNTLIPLDMIFVSKDLEIVDIISTTPCLEDPCEIYEPKTDALFVIEVNEGFSEAKGLKIGQKVNIPIE